MTEPTGTSAASDPSAPSGPDASHAAVQRSSTPGSGRVVIVGGGITGLTAAYSLLAARPDLHVIVLEARDRVGGNILTEQRDGFLLDAGPDCFVTTKPDALELCRQLGLERELIGTRDEARRVYFAHDGRLEPMPGGLVLGVPTRLGPMLTTPLLSMPGKLRVLAEPFVPPRARHPGADESIHSFVSRRLGQEAARRLAAPLLGGIYAGDTTQLSIDSTFPQLVELERRYGSLVRGYFATQTGSAARDSSPPSVTSSASPSWPPTAAAAAAGGAKVGSDPGGSAGTGPESSGPESSAPPEDAPRRGPPRLGLRETIELLRWLRREGQAQASSPFRSLRAGMGSLIARLAERLPAGTLRTGASVARVRRGDATEAPWVVETQDGARFDADAVLLACPAHVAAKLVPAPALTRELSAIPYVSTATVFFALDARRMQHDVAGFGFVAPKGESRLLAGTWVSSKWDGRAPDGHVLVRAFIGGTEGGRMVREYGDEDLTLLARSELIRLMGALGEPLFSRVFRYVESNPQPVVGHGQRLRRIRRCLADLPGLYVAGAPYDGIGIPDCVRQAQEAARSILRERCSG